MRAVLESYDAAPRRAGEPWSAYVARSHGEVAAALRSLPSPDALVSDAVEHFDLLRSRAAEGTDLRAHLTYVLYFEHENGLESRAPVAERGR